MAGEENLIPLSERSKGGQGTTARLVERLPAQSTAMALEHLGRVRVVSVLTGAEQAEERRHTWKNSLND